MTPEQALMLIVKLIGFKLLVRASRVGCDTDFAREIHDILLDHLDEMHADLEDLIDLWTAMERETDGWRQEGLAYDLRHEQEIIRDYWFFAEPKFLGGWRPVDDRNSFYNPADDRVDKDDSDVFVRLIPEARLCGLLPIVEQIAEECGVAFTSEIVFYETRKCRTAHRPAPQPFDPDAEIPF